MDNTLISRAVVQNEFRTGSRSGGPHRRRRRAGGVKAVAPTGTEPISITIPEAEEQVSILGEKLTVERLDGTATYYVSRAVRSPSSATCMIEYQPAPPPKAAPRSRTQARAPEACDAEALERTKRPARPRPPAP